MHGLPVQCGRSATPGLPGPTFFDAPISIYAALRSCLARRRWLRAELSMACKPAVCGAQPHAVTQPGSRAHLGLDASSQGLSADRGSALHVLIAGVGAGADEACLQLGRPAVLLDCLSKLQAQMVRMHHNAGLQTGRLAVLMGLDVWHQRCCSQGDG